MAASERDRRATRPADGSFVTGESPLRQAERAFWAGDFGRARRAIREVLSTSPVEQERAAARELLAKIRVDPVAWWVGGAATLFFGALLLWTYTR